MASTWNKSVTVLLPLFPSPHSLSSLGQPWFDEFGIDGYTTVIADLLHQLIKGTPFVPVLRRLLLSLTPMLVTDSLSAGAFKDISIDALLLPYLQSMAKTGPRHIDLLRKLNAQSVLSSSATAPDLNFSPIQPALHAPLLWTASLQDGYPLQAVDRQRLEGIDACEPLSIAPPVRRYSHNTVLCRSLPSLSLVPTFLSSGGFTELIIFLICLQTSPSTRMTSTIRQRSMTILLRLSYSLPLSICTRLASSQLV
jgi:hypothetical protein